MTRSRATAKKEGTWMETIVVDYLRKHVDDRIFRQAKTGAKDLGDVGGVRIHGQRVAVECKNTTRMALPEWLKETEAERGNLDALAGLIVHKRYGSKKPAKQLVTMELGELVALITGSREHYETEKEEA